MRYLISLNPANEQVLGRVRLFTRGEIIGIVAKAKDAFESWGKDVYLRERCLYRLNALIVKKKKNIAQLIHDEEGKPLHEANDEVAEAISVIEYYLTHITHVLQVQEIRSSSFPSKKNYLVPEPYGVVGVIVPWNYPFSTPLWASVPALLVGNAVVLKPSEHTPLTARLLTRLMKRAGFPQGVFQVVYGGEKEGRTLSEAPISKLAFTGSVETGKKVLAQVSSRVTPVALELGGNDPMLVLKDADIDVAARAAVWGAFTNAGQVCTSVKRCFVHQKIYNNFVNRVVSLTKKLQQDVHYGPLVDESQLNKIRKSIASATRSGAIILTGGEMKERGFYLSPCVLVGVTPKMDIVEQETFGPVLPIMKYSSLNQVIKVVNKTPYGLGASIFTRDAKKGFALAGQIEAGLVWINDVNVIFTECPWGGYKQSGFGKTLGIEGAKEFVRTKVISVERTQSLKEWWFLV